MNSDVNLTELLTSISLNGLAPFVFTGIYHDIFEKLKIHEHKDILTHNNLKT